MSLFFDASIWHAIHNKTLSQIYIGKPFGYHHMLLLLASFFFYVLAYIPVWLKILVYALASYSAEWNWAFQCYTLFFLYTFFSRVLHFIRTGRENRLSLSVWISNDSNFWLELTRKRRRRSFLAICQFDFDAKIEWKKKIPNSAEYDNQISRWKGKKSSVQIVELKYIVNTSEITCSKLFATYARSPRIESAYIWFEKKKKKKKPFSFIPRMKNSMHAVRYLGFEWTAMQFPLQSCRRPLYLFFFFPSRISIIDWNASD